MQKNESVDDNEPSRRVGYQIYTSFRCRNASNDQGKGIQTNELKGENFEMRMDVIARDSLRQQEEYDA